VRYRCQFNFARAGNKFVIPGSPFPGWPNVHRSDNLARACVDTTGEQRAYINTPQTAADMNSILDTIGQKEMY
jgi:hypothetical protein